MMETDDKPVTVDGVDVDETFIVKTDAGELCRLCANTDNQLIPIFRGEGLEHNLPVKIKTHLPIIKVTEVDKLPLQICYQCASTLISWHNLYEGCRVADKRLREILSIDDKSYQEDETYADYVDDYRDDYDDETHESMSTPTPNTSNLASNTLKDMNPTEVSTSSDTKTLETESDRNNERCVAQGTRKRGSLTAKKRPASVAGNTGGGRGSEERAKMVKSKKIRPGMMESPPVLPSSAESGSSPLCKKFRSNVKIKKSKCNICGVSFTDLDDLNWHKDTIHEVSDPLSSAVSAVRKSSRIQARAIDKAKVVRHVESMEKSNSDEELVVNDVIMIDSLNSSVKNGRDSCENNVSKKSSYVKNALYCHHCEYTCKSKPTMSKHMRNYHPSELTGQGDKRNQSILSCSICLKTFTHKTNLRKHVFSHNPPNNGDCEEVNKSEIKWKRGFCCDICDRAFPNQRDLLAHRDIVHYTEAPLDWMNFFVSHARVSYCDKCCKYFREKRFPNHECKSDSEEVTEKIQLMLESSPSFKCDICSLCFHWKWMYRSHRERIHPTVPVIDWDTLTKEEITIYCKSCLKAFEDEETLAKHCVECVVNRENKVEMFVCGLCGRSFCRKPDLQRHLKVKHPDPDQADVKDVVPRAKQIISCPYCDIKMSSRSSVLQHIKDAHDIETDTPYVCVPCNKVFKRKATLDMHTQIYHPKEEDAEETEKILKEAEILLDGETAYHCNICNRNVLNSGRFVAHYRLHKLERKFTCDLCGKQTRTQHQLNTHIKFIHLDIRNFECDICGKGFHSKQSCEEHRRIHTGERPFSCEICGKTFIAMNALFTHKKFHNDFFAHPCSMCPKKFKVRRSLINHIRTHTGERPYKCDLCPKTFNNSSRFSYHKKVTHSDNRPFTCDQCGSCFKANKFLMRHMKLHTTRTHIQFRRRNNPAYFANNENNAKKPKTFSSKESNQTTTNSHQPVATKIYTVAPFYTFSKIIRNEAETLPIDGDLTSGDKEQALTNNSGQNKLDAVSVNDNKDIVYL